jgi:hypothetical protein
MADDTRQSDQNAPNNASAMEQAEGSRDTVQGGRGSQHAAGITNRPIDEEREEQESLPPRGVRKDDDSHA